MVLNLCYVQIMKKCTACKLQKSITEFNKNKSRKDGLQSKCRACSKQYAKEHYNKNKPYYKEKSKLYREHLRTKLDAVKQKSPCKDCGNFYHPVCMDFDHVNDDKVDSVSVLLTSASWEVVLEEISKCDLVCANCHRLRTHKRYSGIV